MRVNITQTMAFAILAISSCKSNDQGPGPILETGDEGISSPDVDLPSGETADEPGPVALPTGECIQYAKPDKYFGFVHQCEGRAKLSYQAKSESGSYSFTFGPGAKNPGLWVRPDNYALPLVAACCGRFNYENPTHEQKLGSPTVFVGRRRA